MSRSFLILATALAALAAGASAAASAGASADCMPCNACRTQACWKSCSVCRPRETPEEMTIPKASICVDLGTSQGEPVAQDACAYAMRLCAPNNRLLLAADADAAGAVSMSQCSRVAAASCRAAAAAALPAACAAAAQAGVGACSAERFRALLDGRAGAQCKAYAIMVTEVNPDTNGWVPSNPQLRTAADEDVADANTDAAAAAEAAGGAEIAAVAAAPSPVAPQAPALEAAPEPVAPTKAGAQQASVAADATAAPRRGGDDAATDDSSTAPAANAAPSTVGGRRMLRLV